MVLAIVGPYAQLSASVMARDLTQDIDPNQKDPGQQICEAVGARELDVCDTSDPEFLRFCYRGGVTGLTCLGCGVESLRCCPGSIVDGSYGGELDDGCVEGYICDLNSGVQCVDENPRYPDGFPSFP